MSNNDFRASLSDLAITLIFATVLITSLYPLGYLLEDLLIVVEQHFVKSGTRPDNTALLSAGRHVLQRLSVRCGTLIETLRAPEQVAIDIRKCWRVELQSAVIDS